MSEAIGDDPDSKDSATYEQIRKILHGTAGASSWKKIQSIVRVLAQQATPPRNPDAEAGRFLLLWSKAVDPAGKDPALAAAAAEVLVHALPDTHAPNDGSSVKRNKLAALPEEIKRVMAFLSPEDLVALHRRLLAEDRQDEAVNLLVAIGRTYSPHGLIEVIEKLRMSRRHQDAIRVIREAVRSWNIWEIECLVQLFWKEEWRVDALSEAIAAFLPAEEVAHIIRLMREVSPVDADALRRKFDELRDAEQVEALEEALASS
ncbi:hypothetical protein ACFV7Q_16170 [Streptomyces sp. NPDC059851]|uniref:hypothetical protein n=1 Tax=Streptomyces sp. NPDC059851 TaxID=3346971 RepID=UPI00365BDCDA